jgi:hypothetical protein
MFQTTNQLGMSTDLRKIWDSLKKSPISIGQRSLLRECSNPGTFSACSRTSRLFTWFKYTMASLEASNAEGE